MNITPSLIGVPVSLSMALVSWFLIYGPIKAKKTSSEIGYWAILLAALGIFFGLFVVSLIIMVEAWVKFSASRSLPTVLKARAVVSN